MVFVVELLVLELVHHFCIGRNLFPPNVYKPLVSAQPVCLTHVPILPAGMGQALVGKACTGLRGSNPLCPKQYLT
jgi:hypothetical protein